MKIFYSPYFLKPKHSLNSLSQRNQREGALIKIEEGEYAGFADLHPLREFGDAPLSDHLESLKTSSPSPLVARSLFLAHRDLQARKTGASLYGHVKLKNNFAIPDIQSFDLQDLGKLQDFKTLKIKIGRDWKKEAEILNCLQRDSFKLRLDANASFTANSFNEFLDLLDKRVIESLEYIEDPTPYDLEIWKSFQKRVPIAIDFEYSKAPESLLDAGFSAVVLKSSRQNVEDIVDKSVRAGLKITFTSSMDHLVGIAHGVSIAQYFKSKFPESLLDSGFLTHDLFEEDMFSLKVSIKEATLYFSEESGIGFTAELNSCQWVEL